VQRGHGLIRMIQGFMKTGSVLCNMFVPFEPAFFITFVKNIHGSAEREE
jgi:hypothetical protein